MNILTSKRTGFIIIAIGAVFILIAFNYAHLAGADTLFKDSVNSIVELKCCSENRGESFGTAIFIEDNLLVTNAHVVTYKENGSVCEYEQCSIRFAAEDVYREVSVLKYDNDLDIAVLKFEDTSIKHKAIKTGNSDGVDYGDKVYSIGNSVNYGLSISEGIISAPAINIEYDGILRNVIQSDLNITYGNSGGALLDKYGRLIGITSFRMKDANGDIVYGIAYSIPVNQILDYINQ